MATTTKPATEACHLSGGQDDADVESMHNVDDDVDSDSVVDRLAYDPFGVRVGTKPPESPAGAPTSKIDLGFAGHAQDDEPALAFVDMKAIR